jgi:hypothetical protein
MARKMKVPLALLTSDVDPANGNEGWVYFNIVNKNLRIHNGTVWVDLTPPSEDPTPFYMHTHTYDGEVHTINIQNKVDFNWTNTESGPELHLPQIIGLEGGDPMSVTDNANRQDLTLWDGGVVVDEIVDPGDTVLDGGGSVNFDGDIIDGGGSQ